VLNPVGLAPETSTPGTSTGGLRCRESGISRGNHGRGMGITHGHKVGAGGPEPGCQGGYRSQYPALDEGDGCVTTRRVSVTATPGATPPSPTWTRGSPPTSPESSGTPRPESWQAVGARQNHVWSHHPLEEQVAGAAAPRHWVSLYGMRAPRRMGTWRGDCAAT